MAVEFGGCDKDVLLGNLPERFRSSDVIAYDMKREMGRVLLLMGVGALLATSCYTRRVVVRESVAAPTGEVVVSSEPPRLRHEVIIGEAPGPAHVWVAGFWANRDGRWVWIPGHWERGPHVGAHWTAGNWVHRTRGWVWIEGRWD